LLRQLQKNGAVALPLQVPPAAYEAKAGLYVVDEGRCAHGAGDLVVADQDMGELAGREFARVVLII
jgi:hypothetical protein